MERLTFMRTRIFPNDWNVKCSTTLAPQVAQANRLPHLGSIWPLISEPPMTWKKYQTSGSSPPPRRLRPEDRKPEDQKEVGCWRFCCSPGYWATAGTVGS